MSEPAALWKSLLPRITDSKKHSSKRHDYCKKVLDLLEKRHPDLYSGQTGAVLLLDETQSLVAELQKNTPGHVFKHRLSFLISGLEIGTLQLGWNVVIPEPALVIPREKPRFNHESFSALQEVYDVEAVFLQHLKNSPPQTYTTRVGQLLLSAILYGGMVHKQWLTPWVESLSSANCFEDQLWMDMVLKPVHSERVRRAAGKTGKVKPDHSQVKKTWEIRRRWFADPLTHSLVIRWHNDYQGDLSAGRNVSPMVAIRQYLDLILDKKNRTSESFVNALLRGCATRSGLGMPAFLLAYAEGTIKSVSLPPAVWERLLTGKCVEIPDQPVVADSEQPPVDEPLPVPEPRQIAPMVKQEAMLKEVLRNILPPDTHWKRRASEAREALQSYYELHRESMCQTLSCLVLWCIDLLTTYNRQELINGRVKGKIRASSVRRYLDAIGKRLVAVANKEEILNLEGDELHDLYSEVIDACPTPKSKNKAGARLYGFHQFLMARLKAQGVDFSDLSVSSGPAEASVDANLISLDSFDRMKSVLCPNYKKASRIRKIQLLMTILAFRCGLRRTEVLKLRLIDLQGVAEPELLVRNNRYAYVKSNESIRRLPLACLLEDDELKLLLDWRRDRILEDGATDPNALLFCLEDHPSELMPSSAVFPAIMLAIRQVTGDPSIVFHHFRHSFATWMVLRLLQNFSQDIRRRYHFLNHHLFEPEACLKLRTALLGNHSLGRQALYATAQLCGHAGPEVTLLHYIHLCDWLLGVESSASKNQPVLDATTLNMISGISQHILYYDKSRHHDGVWQASLVLDRSIPPDRLRSKSVLQKVSTRPIPDKHVDHKDVQHPTWRRIFNVIRERQISGFSIKALATRSGFTIDEIEVWCGRVECLAGMKTRQGHPRHINNATYKDNPAFHFPESVSLPEDRIMADDVLSSFNASRGRTRDCIMQGARYFVAHFSAAKGKVLCKKDIDAKKYIRFLLLLNIPPLQIRVIRTQPKKTRLTPENELKFLAHKLALPEASVTVLSPGASETYLTGCYHIQVKSAQICPKGRHNSIYGFRFAMYMITIMAGLDDGLRT